MQWSAVVCILSIFSVALASIPLTITIPASERKCVYTYAYTPDTNIRAEFTVMSGGQFDIDATLTRPDKTVAESVHKSESEEWMLRAQHVGEFELCFYNEMSTFADKVVQFEFDAGAAAISATPPEPANEEHTLAMEQYVADIDYKASRISRKLGYLKARTSRNESTVKSTASRVWWYTLFEIIAVVAIAVFNVSIVQVFFKGSRKNIV